MPHRIDPLTAGKPPSEVPMPDDPSPTPPPSESPQPSDPGPGPSSPEVPQPPDLPEEPPYDPYGRALGAAAAF